MDFLEPYSRKDLALVRLLKGGQILFYTLASLFL
jgi:hypothetical protein